MSSPIRPLLLLALVILCAPLRAAPAGDRPRPNIVFILLDDLGWGDIGCYGSDFHETPRMDRMAAEGLRFTAAYANAPNCAPTRACLMSGQYSPRHGIFTVNNAARGKAIHRRLVPTTNTTVLADQVVTIAEALGAAGYTSACVGKWHLGDDPCSQGFDVNVGGNHKGHPKSYFSPYSNEQLPDGPEGEYLTDRLTDEALAFMRENRERPFFLYLSHFAVHTPVQAPSDAVDRYKRKDADRKAAGESGGHARYAAMIEALDESVGRVLDGLDELGLTEDTLVVLFSDNGGHANFTDMAPLRGSKGMLYEGGVREPLLVRWPGRVEAGTTCDVPVIGVDFFPTFLELTGATPPADIPLDGESLVALLDGADGSEREAIYWHFPVYLESYRKNQGRWRTTPAGAIRAGRYKLHEFFEDGHVELYDLDTDPGEIEDLAAAMPERAAALRESLHRWRESVDAPVPTERNPAFRGEVSFVADGKALDVFGGWEQGDGSLFGSGKGNRLIAGERLGEGDFIVHAHLRMEGQEKSAASFFLDADHFGFEGAQGTVFVSGPVFGGLQLLGPSTEVFERGAWIDFEAERKGGRLVFRIDGEDVYEIACGTGPVAELGFEPLRSTMQVSAFSAKGDLQERAAPMARGYSIPLIDLAYESERQTVVDREEGQYLGHPTTVLLEDGRTMITVYPKGHGRGAIVMKRSADGGRTWSDRLPVPDSWATSKETPTIHRVVDPGGVRRLIVFSGLYPIRMAVSEDDGETWSELEPIGDYGGIVAMGCVERLANGDYLAMFHDDGRFFRDAGKSDGVMRLFQIFSSDGGLTWGEPMELFASSDIHLCEPGIVRSPDGEQLAVLMRENRRRRNSHVIFSDDEAKTWSTPRELPGSLTGDRHTGRYGPDGRLFLSFRDTTLESPTKGDWVGWVGTYADIVEGREGQYRVRLMDNHNRGDCAYPGVEILPDGTFVTTTYGHWTAGESPYVVSVHLTMEELDERARALEER